MAADRRKKTPVTVSGDGPRPRQTRDAARAQAKILSVARAHFVSQGFAGARVDEIAEASGYSKAMLYHYYGNKEKLYVAVLEEVYKHFVAPRRVLNLAEVGPVAALEAFIREGAASLTLPVGG